MFGVANRVIASDLHNIGGHLTVVRSAPRTTMMENPSDDESFRLDRRRCHVPRQDRPHHAIRKTVDLIKLLRVILPPFAESEHDWLQARS